MDIFLKITNEAGAIYRRYGAINSGTMRVTEATAKYGCMGLTNVVAVDTGEELFIGVDSFRNSEECRSLMTKIDADPRINELYQQIKDVVELARVIRWEAEDVD